MADDPFRAERDELENILGALEGVNHTLSKAAFGKEQGSQITRRLSHAAAHIKSAMDLVQFSQDRLQGCDDNKELIFKSDASA
jgi:bisphosphoglycerate-dependent phosphoglycerate mutase